jgi:GT2 family glycosyltransferase
MDVSVIIVNYNTVKYLTDAIDSVFEKTKDIEFEIIVVDNNSSDNSEFILKEKYGGRIVYLRLAENVGFGRANNIAATAARGRNLFLLNPDTILLNNAIKILSDFLDKNMHVAVCGGNLFDEARRPACSFCRLFPSIADELNRLFLNLPARVLYGRNVIFNYTNKPIEVAFVIGADMMVRKNIFDELAGFDRDFFMFFEEIDLEYRMHKSGYKVISVPDAHIVHLEGKSVSIIERYKKYLIARDIYLNKTWNGAVIFLINIIFYVEAVFRLVIFTIMGNGKKIAMWSFIARTIFGGNAVSRGFPEKKQ